jgi:hypothetical protein
MSTHPALTSSGRRSGRTGGNWRGAWDRIGCARPAGTCLSTLDACCGPYVLTPAEPIDLKNWWSLCSAAHRSASPVKIPHHITAEHPTASWPDKVEP